MITYLAFDPPWPPYAGGSLRDYYLLRELSRAYPIDLHVLTWRPLTAEQCEMLGKYANHIVPIPRRDTSFADRVQIGVSSLISRVPFHTAILEHSLTASGSPLPGPQDGVFASPVHWAMPLWTNPSSRWVIDLQNADVQFWEVYARQQSGMWRWLARINARLTHRFCQRVYARAACVIAVCEEDRTLTRQVSPSAHVEVIPNGVDCAYFTPPRRRPYAPVLLFTGTSAARNRAALRWFITEVYPSVRGAIPDAELLIAGDFDGAAQREFSDVAGIRFTGRQPDLRPYCQRAAVFINPFQEAYGSKVKVSQALAMGLPVISTPAGIRGFPLQDGESVLLGNDASEFAAQTIRALSDKPLRARLGEAGRHIAESELDWERIIGPRLREIVGRVFAGGQMPPAAGDNQQ